jgi:hypothetical protein
MMSTCTSLVLERVDIVIMTEDTFPINFDDVENIVNSLLVWGARHIYFKVNPSKKSHPGIGLAKHILSMLLI